MRIVDYLEQNAQRYPEKTAVVCGGESCSYARLWQLVQQRAATLPTRQVIAFRTTQTIDFLVSYLAIHLAGSVAAPLEKGMPEGLYREVSDRLAACPVSDDAADVLYTTGTTGRPKRRKSTHFATPPKIILHYP